MNIRKLKSRWCAAVSFDEGTTLFDMAYGRSLRTVKVECKKRMLPHETMHIRRWCLR